LGRDAGNLACKFLFRIYGTGQTGLSASRSGYKIENAKQPSVVGPQFYEIKPGLASQGGKTLWRVLVGMLRQDLFTRAEVKLSILYANCLISLADQIHLDAACFSVVYGAVFPLV
jgi:hypothetical protein